VGASFVLGRAGRRYGYEKAKTGLPPLAIWPARPRRNQVVDG